MLIRVVRMTFQPDKVQDFLIVFNQSKSNIRNFKGCLHLELRQDYHQDHIYFTYSHWKDSQALDAYRNSPLFRSVWKDTKVLFREKATAFSMKNIDEVVL